MNQELKTKILEAQLKLKEQELQHLKMQIHPHFLFNTLNTLYGFAIKKSEKTPDMILKLSNLLDYLLYQTDKPSVALQEEVDHILDYIALEKMRFSDTLDLGLVIKNINSSLQIAPMLFIPFVENSFKHGQIRNKKLSVTIHMTCVENDIHFRIKNSIISNQNNEKQGIGLANIQKRLNLLYKDKHHLTITEDENWYCTDLIINT